MKGTRSQKWGAGPEAYAHTTQGDAARFIHGPTPQVTLYGGSPKSITLFYNYLICIYSANFLITRQCQMQGGKEQPLRRIRHTPQGDANAANAAGGIVW